MRWMRWMEMNGGECDYIKWMKNTSNAIIDVVYYTAKCRATIPS